MYNEKKTDAIRNIIEEWSESELLTAWNKRCELDGYPEDFIAYYEGEDTLRAILNGCSDLEEFMLRTRDINPSYTYLISDGYHYATTYDINQAYEVCDIVAEFIAREGNVRGIKDIDNDDLIDAYCEYSGLSKERVQAYLDDMYAELTDEDWDNLEEQIDEWWENEDGE